MRFGLRDRDRKTRLPGSLSPSIAPGLAQCAVTRSPVEIDVGQEALVALDEAAFDEGFRETHGMGAIQPEDRFPSQQGATGTPRLA